MDVAALMTKNPYHVRVQTSVAEAIRIMQEHDIRHLPVVENHELVGILSDRDVRGLFLQLEDAIVAPDKLRKRLEMKVSELMRTSPITVAPEDSITEVIDIFIENKLSAVPVLDAAEGRLVGIVSYIDILRASREHFED